MDNYYIIESVGSEYTVVVVGWDPCLATFYGQIFYDDADPPMYVWIGNTPREIRTVEELAGDLLDHDDIVIPESTKILLRMDSRIRKPLIHF